MTGETTGTAPGTGTANVPAATATSTAEASVVGSAGEGQAPAAAATTDAAGGSDTASTAADSAAADATGSEGGGEPSGDAGDGATGEGDGAEGDGTGDQPEALSVPDGMAITPEWQQQLDEYAGARGLDHAGKQGIVDMGVKLHQQLLENITNAHKERVEAWEQEARKEHGQKFDAVVSAAQRAFGQFGSPALKELMVQYGIGNHPAMLNAFAAVAARVTESTGIAGTGTAQAGEAVDENSEEARAARMYGSATKSGGRRGR